MNNFGQRLLASLTPGVRGLLGLLVTMYLAAIIGKVFGIYDLYSWLALSGPKFWSGQIWRLVTYFFLPTGILDFIMNYVALVLLGRLLERLWSRRQLWLYFLLTAAGAGLVKVLLQFSNPLPLTGCAPVIFGLLIAWGFLCGREIITLTVFGQTTVWRLVLTASAVSVLVMFFTAGIVAALILAGGGFTGWLYLWLNHKWLMTRPSNVVRSERINRLEL
jgi:membrane associated rhomboid family serine protease